MRIELICAECGKNRFNLRLGTDDVSLIRCDACGHVIGTLAELKEPVAAEVLKRAAATSSWGLFGGDYAFCRHTCLG